MKFFIVGAQCSGKEEVANMTISDHPEVKLGKKFSNAAGKTKFYMDNYYEYFTEQEIRDIFENKAYVFLKGLDELTYDCYNGLTTQSFDDNDIFVLTPDEFVSIPLTGLPDDICILWLDNTYSNRITRYKVKNCKHSFQKREDIEKPCMDDFVENVYSFPRAKVIYFTNEMPEKISAILYALYKDNTLIPEFSKKFN